MNKYANVDNKSRDDNNNSIGPKANERTLCRPPTTTTTITVLRKQAVSFSLQELSSVGLREKNALWPTWILVKWLIKKNISKQWWYLVAFSLCWFLVKISKNYLFFPRFGICHSLRFRRCILVNCLLKRYILARSLRLLLSYILQDLFRQGFLFNISWFVYLSTRRLELYKAQDALNLESYRRGCSFCFFYSFSHIYFIPSSNFSLWFASFFLLKSFRIRSITFSFNLIPSIFSPVFLLHISCFCPSKSFSAYFFFFSFIHIPSLTSSVISPSITLSWFSS